MNLRTFSLAMLVAVALITTSSLKAEMFLTVHGTNIPTDKMGVLQPSSSPVQLADADEAPDEGHGDHADDTHHADRKLFVDAHELDEIEDKDSRNDKMA